MLGVSLSKKHGRKEAVKGRFYRKSLVMILVVASIPGLITGAFLYWAVNSQLEDELLVIHNKQIEQRARHIDAQLVNMEMMLSHWAFDTVFDYSLEESNFITDFNRAHDITNTLIVMQGSNTIIKGVSLYLKGSDPPVKFEPEYGTIASAGLQDTYNKLLGTKQAIYWSQLSFDTSRSDQQELVLVHHIPGGSRNPFGLLALRLDNEKVREMLRTMTPYSGGETFFMQNNGELYLSAEGNAKHSDFVKALHAEIGSRGESGSFFFKWNDITFAVTYGQLSRISDNWTFVSASPITGISEPIITVSKVIIIVSLCALLLAALLAWLASRSIYNPVKRLVSTLQAGRLLPQEHGDEFSLIESHWQHLHRESSELNRRLSDQLPYVKESFLHQLLQGYLHAYSEDELQARMKQYKWQLNGRIIIIMYMQMTGMASLEGKFKDGDEGLVTFAAFNMIEELSDFHFEQHNAVNFHNLAIGLLIVMKKENDYESALKLFSEELTASINRLLKMKLTVAISKPTTKLSTVPLLFEEAKLAASYRSLESENQIIALDSSRQLLDGDAEHSYPFTLEREFIQALRTGRESDADTLLHEFVAALSGSGAKEIDVQQGMLHLLGSVLHAVMSSGIGPNTLYKGVNLYARLSQIREPKLQLAWFKKHVVAPYLHALNSRSDAGTKRLIEQAMIYLQQNYMRDISLDNCADHIGTNPFFLSKAFKAVTGVNFIDYLTGLRLDKAKELLRDSALKINDVAEQVGYQHSYFNRIFKRVEGMTPSRYRELSQVE